MIINKTGRLNIGKQSFTFGNETLTLTKMYTYLGIEIHNCGSFTEAISNIKAKALKVYFKLCKDLYNSKTWLKIKTYTTLIMPIML